MSVIGMEFSRSWAVGFSGKVIDSSSFCMPNLNAAKIFTLI